MKILLAEDSYIERRKLAAHLTEWGFDHVAVGSGTEAIKLLESGSADLALLGWSLPGLDGIDILRRIRKATQGSYIYTVMLTAKSQKQDRLMAMEAGADDYLLKPVDPAELRSRIMVGKRILDLQQSLRFASTHDVLTGLLNQSEILAALDRELARGGREGKPSTVIVGDLDNFKRINETLGHAAGDIVLKEVARRLKLDLRPYDIVGRCGGEKFLIILPGCTPTSGAHRADSIRTRVGKDPIETSFGKATATISMGLTASSEKRDRPASELLHEADICLSLAKKKGGNCVEVYSAQSAAAGKS
jgi:two-component system, cell cycle response regulator